MMSTQQHQQQNRHHHDQQSRVFYELSVLVMNLMRSPPSPMTFTDHSPPRRRMTSSNSLPPMTPSGFAWLMLGVSLALMLCGSVTFFIGFMLMPWVIGLVMVFYVVGIVSTVSMLGRAIFCSVLGPPPSPRKEIPEWKCM